MNNETVNSYDADYFRKREQHARQLAEAASVPSIRAIHLQMADRYSHFVEQPQVGFAGRST